MKELRSLETVETSIEELAKKNFFNDALIVIIYGVFSSIFYDPVITLINCIRNDYSFPIEQLYLSFYMTLTLLIIIFYLYISLHERRKFILLLRQFFTLKSFIDRILLYFIVYSFSNIVQIAFTDFSIILFAQSTQFTPQIIDYAICLGISLSVLIIIYLFIQFLEKIGVKKDV